MRTALHDFACGVGELACLAELPVHAVRIAQPVARQVAEDASAIPTQALRAVVPMVRSSGISVACEVDTEEQADWWRGVGADRVVGRLFGEPGPAQFVGRMLGSPVAT